MHRHRHIHTQTYRDLRDTEDSHKHDSISYVFVEFDINFISTTALHILGDILVYVTEEICLNTVHVHTH